jgi:hypothetical protein
MSEWLNVSSTAPRIAYTATAGQTAFTIPFVFFENAELRVYRNGLLLTLAVDYTVTGAENENGGTLTLLTGATLGRVFTDYQTLVETCRQRADEIGISRLELDRLAGLPQGYSGKLLGRDGAGAKQKRMWPIGLEALLGTLGLKVLLIEDEAATARTLSLRTPVDRAQQRFGNVSRIGSVPALPPPEKRGSATKPCSARANAA